MLGGGGGGGLIVTNVGTTFCHYTGVSRPGGERPIILPDNTASSRYSLAHGLTLSFPSRSFRSQPLDSKKELVRNFFRPSSLDTGVENTGGRGSDERIRVTTKKSKNRYFVSSLLSTPSSRVHGAGDKYTAQLLRTFIQPDIILPCLRAFLKPTPQPHRTTSEQR